MDLQGVEKAAGDGADDAAEDHEWDVVACDGDEDAGCDGEEAGTEDEREVLYTGVLSAVVAGSLEVDGQVVQQEEEGAGDKKDVGTLGGYGAVLEQAALEESAVAGVVLNSNEGDEEDGEHN